MLRKHYQSRLVKALLFTFLMVVVLLLVAKLFKEEKAKEFRIAEPGYVKLLPGVIAELPKTPRPPVPPKQASKRMSAEQWVSTVEITPDESPVTKLSNNLDSAGIGSTAREAPYPGGPLIAGPETGEEITGKNPVPATVMVDKETPRHTADVMPAFPGGMAALRKFLERNLENPQDIEPGTVVSVKIRFVVGYDGKLKGFQTIEDGGEPFNNEVLRVLKIMPEWIPGKSNGEKVSVYYTIPVKFTTTE